MQFPPFIWANIQNLTCYGVLLSESKAAQMGLLERLNSGSNKGCKAGVWRTNQECWGATFYQVEVCTVATVTDIQQQQRNNGRTPGHRDTGSIRLMPRKYFIEKSDHLQTSNKIFLQYRYILVILWTIDLEHFPNSSRHFGCHLSLHCHLGFIG